MSKTVLIAAEGDDEAARDAVYESLVRGEVARELGVVRQDIPEDPCVGWDGSTAPVVADPQPAIAMGANR